MPDTPACLNSQGTPLASNVGAVIASTTTIAPTSFMQHVSGTTAIKTITAPTGFLGLIYLIADGAWTTITTGNIGLAITAVANQAVPFVYDGATWYPVSKVT
jgi:hypothetical protein